MLKNMFLKINIIFFCLFLLILTTNNVSAHPPLKLNIKYIKENEVVFVNISHSVTTDNHYIKSIEIQLNGENYDTFEYTSQPSRTSFSYNYTIAANDGDNIKIKAICNQFGTLTRELTIGENNNGSS
ncbi:MAG: hypothetical protein KAJ21_01525, partial [Thermoplasmatales archaeon]|nr:hypothetical protein [Thermoplasmatales archaeon]